jgi:hypothetical protein
VTLIKAAESEEAFSAGGVFPLGKNLVKNGTNGAVGTAELLGPVHEHLSIAQRAEAAEEFSAGLAEVCPVRVEVDFGHDRGNGAAAAEGDAEIMNSFGILHNADAVHLFEGLVHPEWQDSVSGFACDRMGNGRSHGFSLRGGQDDSPSALARPEERSGRVPGRQPDG